MPRARARAASTSRSRGLAVVTREPINTRAAAATSSTARSKATSFALDGTLNPLSFLTNCSEASRISSSVAGGSKLNKVLMFRHTGVSTSQVAGEATPRSPADCELRSTVDQNASGGNSSKRGSASVISYQGALDATWRWTTGANSGSVSSVPAGMMTWSPCSSTTGMLEPQILQNARMLPGDDSKRSTRWNPLSQRKSCPSACTKVPKAAPCTLRHIEQWQWLMN